MGDLQWTIVHGAIAISAFASILNLEVSQKCPFCSEKETMFHAFLHCVRLRPIIFTLQRYLIDWERLIHLQWHVMKSNLCTLIT